ncbi:MAG: DUF362 domain-containing protein [Endomicrobia bacterium]|nr:DUF362 domain-containing protein [Endomicrobiia bacterium]
MKELNKIVISKCYNYNWGTIFNILLLHLKSLQITNCIQGKTVLLKPNLLGPHKPEDAVTTHPEFIRAVIRLCKKLNCKEILVGDSPSVVNFDEVVVKTGVKQLCSEENVKLLNLSTYPVIEKPYNRFGLKKIVVSRIINDVDFIINLPKLKTHSLTVITCAVKNMYGIVPGMTKSLYHKYAPHPREFLDIVYTVYNFRHPDLTIVDGIIGMDGEGPAGGDVKNFALVLSSQNGLCIDWYVANKIFHMSENLLYKKEWLLPAKVKYIETDEKYLNELKTRLPSTIPVFLYLPSFVLNILKQFVWFKPKIDNKLCKKCGKCYDICPQKTIKIVNKNYVIFYDRCITCLCCQETCPYKAVKILRSPLYQTAFLIKEFVYNMFKKF